MPHVVRALPVTAEQWSSYMDNDGRVNDINVVKDAIFRGVRYSMAFVHDLIAALVMYVHCEP